MRPDFTRITRNALETFTPNRSRHRAESLQNDRRFAVAASVVAGCTAIAISLSVATGFGATGALANAATPLPVAAIDRPAAQPDPIVRSSIIAEDGASAGPVTGGTVVTVTGEDLAKVASVSFGGNAGAVTSATADTVTITTPAATDLVTGTVTVELFDIDGKAVKVSEASLNSAAPASATQPTAASVPAGLVAAAALTPTTATTMPPLAAAAPLIFNYLPDPAIAAAAAAAEAAAVAEAAAAEAAAQAAAASQAAVAGQIDYVLTHWQNYNSDQYGYISGNDCVNFTSQSLIARGWTMDGEWSYNSGAYSSAWASSTAFANYLSNHPERATALSDAQRDQVKVGDIVQFDWDNSGDRDHTGIVTRVDKSEAGTQIFYAGHTNDTDFKSVDGSGATVSYWSVA